MHTWKCPAEVWISPQISSLNCFRWVGHKKTSIFFRILKFETLWHIKSSLRDTKKSDRPSMLELQQQPSRLKFIDKKRTNFWRKVCDHFMIFGKTEQQGGKKWSHSWALTLGSGRKHPKNTEEFLNIFLRNVLNERKIACCLCRGRVSEAKNKSEEV